ncbi:sigma factor [Acidicapsa dinghuensis]|uniref:Sigma factor n=1 Tax=Acidicapsa dinghuensis TaxID=2218256 RepID=A0ABW1ECK2_9BACT|nr:sigma factor [Acidicapsa dinghuensis]
MTKTRDNDDSLLLERTRLGDVQSLACLYDRYSGFVYSIALRILRDQPRAEQVVSDLFFQIWRSPDRFERFTANLALALVVVARNRALAVLAQKSSDLDFLVPEWIANYRAKDITREQARAVLENLSADRRSMLERTFYEATRPTTSSRSTTNSTMPGEAPSTTTAVSKLVGTGLEVIDLEADDAFARRRLHVRDSILHLQGMNRLTRTFIDGSQSILQELVTAAVELCGADSAGISIVQENSTEEDYYQWVATAGQYSGFLNAKLPRYPSACGVTLERRRPQIFRVSQKFFDLMGIQAPIVTDGLLLPWEVENGRGTIWIMAHGRAEAFDREDCKIMEVLSNFAASGVRLQRQQRTLLEQARVAGEAALANSIAQQINRPLEELRRSVFLLSQRDPGSDSFAQMISGELTKLSEILNQLVPGPKPCN